VSGSSGAKSAPSARKRHPLLFQQSLSEQVFWPSVTIIAVCAALLLWNPAKLAPYRVHMMIILTGTGLVLIATLVFRMRAYVQCRPEGVRLQLPLYRLIIPYEAIRATRPTELYRMFPPSKERWPQRQYLMRLSGVTVVVLEMDELPAPRFQLRLWLPKYMLSPDRTGLVLAVPDWMALRSDLDELEVRSRQHNLRT
jgi:hypothetical protein